MNVEINKMDNSDFENNGDVVLSRTNNSLIELKSHDVRSLINFIKVMKGRYLFLKLKEISDIIPVEGASIVIPEKIAYQDSIAQLLNHLLKQYLILNEVHGQVLNDLSLHPKKFQNSNNIQLMLENKKKILNLSYQINEIMQTEKKYMSELIYSNKKWCALEKELMETLEQHLGSVDKESSHFREQKKINAKKNKKIQQIQIICEVILRIMSIHCIDYMNNNDFKNILYRVNRTKNQSLLDYPMDY